MVAELSYSRVTGNIIPIDDNGDIMPLLAAKLAASKQLSVREIRLVNGFRLLLEVNSRRVGTGDKLFLALRLVLSKDGIRLDKTEIFDQYKPKLTVVANEILSVPKTFDRYLGMWNINVGYAALRESEFVPQYTQAILASLPYVFDERNLLHFEVSESGNPISANGEWAHRVDADEMASSGRTRPGDI